MPIYAGHTNSYHGFSLEQALQSIAKTGFKYCELAAVKGWTEHVRSDMTDEELAEVKALLKKYDITPISLSGHCNLMDEARLDDFVKNIELAAKLGCKYIISSAGEAHFAKNETFTNDGLISNIKKIVPVLEKYDIKMVIEIHGEHHGSGEKLYALTRGVNSPYVGINYDTANCVFYGKVDPVKDVDTCIDDVMYVHLKDHKGADNEWNFPGVGNGDLPLKEFMEKMDAHGYDGVYTIEIEYTEEFCFKDKTEEDLAVPDKEMADSYAYLKALGRIK